LGTAAEDVIAVPDLCGLAARRDPRLATAAAAPHLSIIACHPRAVQWLFAWAGAPLDMQRTTLYNMRTQSSDEILAGLCLPLDVTTPIPEPAHDGEWVPWFPVIDRERCVNCRQCASFCVFGVYSITADGSVEVTNPDRCKNNCPACARMCPQVAIIFPKCPDEPINGTAVSPDDVRRRQVETLSARLDQQPDIHALLAQRRHRSSPKAEGAS
jgi:Pyruvate/2-oxoacid:ferredoxin oxidoreductase delta subunit